MNFISALTFRVVFESRENYRVMDDQQNLFPAELAGKLRHTKGLWPAVGDWVSGLPQSGGWILITAVLNRHSVLQRRAPGRAQPQVLAANLDVLFIVTSANQDLNLNRLDRYVALAISGNIQPVILINKIELAFDPHVLLDSVARRFPAVDIFGVSAREGWNLDSLEDYVQAGQTAAFVGSSGVGKSTLCNVLLGPEGQIATQEIRASDDRGRHTTSHRELHVTPTGAVVIDTPGIRVVGLSDEIDLNDVFSDVEALTSYCKFSDCQHTTEPGCAILVALKSGDLSSDRWENYLKLGRELAFEQRKTNKELQSRERKRWAKIHRGR